ncbi:MAG TPA: type II toxin-antitoxin system VapC family toxin, partial [Bacteroidia bacterium]|nr:type II toxin-antitoxin system VapC family toxin [Bacteroidia bacterium]
MILDTDLLVAVLRDDEDAIKKIKELERSNDNMFITSVNTFELFRGAFKSRYVEDNLIVVSELINKFDKIIEFDLVASQIAAKVFTKLQDEGISLDLPDV